MRGIKYSDYKNVFLPVALLTATIIGAGIFSLPYIFARAGWKMGLIYLAAAPVIFYYLHTMYADVILRSGGKFKFVGYARHYLGELAFWLSILVTVIGSVLTLTAYLVLAASFAKIIFSAVPYFYHENFSVFWILATAAIFVSVKRMAWFEFYVTVGMVILIFLIFGFGLAAGPGKFLTLPEFNPIYLFLPFGPVLFSFSGRTAIPSLIDYYRENKLSFLNFKKIVLAGTAIPTVVYLMFTVGIIGISVIVTKDSVASIAALPWVFGMIVAAFGLLSLWSSYIVIGLSIYEILRDDLGFNLGGFNSSGGAGGIGVYRIYRFFADYNTRGRSFFGAGGNNSGGDVAASRGVG